MTKVWWKLLWELKFIEEYRNNKITERKLRTLFLLTREKIDEGYDNS